jgi:hypothetical protein
VYGDDFDYKTIPGIVPTNMLLAISGGGAPSRIVGCSTSETKLFKVAKVDAIIDSTLCCYWDGDAGAAATTLVNCEFYSASATSIFSSIYENWLQYTQMWKSYVTNLLALPNAMSFTFVNCYFPADFVIGFSPDTGMDILDGWDVLPSASNEFRMTLTDTNFVPTSTNVLWHASSSRANILVIDAGGSPTSPQDMRNRRERYYDASTNTQHPPITLDGKIDCKLVVSENLYATGFGMTVDGTHHEMPSASTFVEFTLAASSPHIITVDGGSGSRSLPFIRPETFSNFPDGYDIDGNGAIGTWDYGGDSGTCYIESDNFNMGSGSSLCMKLYDNQNSITGVKDIVVFSFPTAYKPGAGNQFMFSAEYFLLNIANNGLVQCDLGQGTTIADQQNKVLWRFEESGKIQSYNGASYYDTGLTWIKGAHIKVQVWVFTSTTFKMRVATNGNPFGAWTGELTNMGAWTGPIRNFNVYTGHTQISQTYIDNIAAFCLYDPSLATPTRDFYFTTKVETFEGLTPNQQINGVTRDIGTWKYGGDVSTGAIRAVDSFSGFGSPNMCMKIFDDKTNVDGVKELLEFASYTNHIPNIDDSYVFSADYYIASYGLVEISLGQGTEVGTPSYKVLWRFEENFKIMSADSAGYYDTGLRWATGHKYTIQIWLTSSTRFRMRMADNGGAFGAWTDPLKTKAEWTDVVKNFYLYTGYTQRTTSYIDNIKTNWIL